jgi:hypothetical protein
MKSKRGLMTALIGLAMLATPITAAAKDHHDGGGRNYSHQESRSYNAPARSYAPAHNFGNRHEFRNERNWNAAPVVAHRDWSGDRHDWNGDRHEYRGGNRGWGDADDYRHYGYGNYGYRSYYAAPAYVASGPYYGGSGYGGNACAWAQHVRNVYARDRYTGHPAAAADLLPRLRNAERACGGVPYSGGGLFSGFGAPAYADYNGYGGYGGYNGYNAYNGYNNYGYQQPGYASMLGPLLQQFVR